MTTIKITKEEQERILRKEISNRFSAWLTHNNISMLSITRQTGMTESGLSLIRSGKRLPGASSLWELAKVGMDIHWLVTGETKQK